MDSPLPGQACVRPGTGRTIEHMFERVSEEPSPLGRVYDPPQPVWVNLAEVYRHVPGPVGGRPSSFVHDRGMVFDGTVTGDLYAWVRTARGAWICLVSYSVNAAFGTVRVRHFVASEAIAKR